MHPPLTDTTKSFWEAVHEWRRKSYADWIVTTGTMSPAWSLVPKDYKFCRVPCEEYNMTVWGFRSREKSDEFAKAYGGERWISMAK